MQSPPVITSILFAGFVTAVSVSPKPRVERIAEGVYAVMRTEAAGHIVNANTGFIVTDRDVIVVDANVTPSTAREVIEAIRTVTTKPVRYVVNTHFHDDHVAGNQAFADAYPGVEFVAHPFTRDDMVGAGAEARAQFAKALPGNVAFARSQMLAGKGFDDKPLTDRKREVLVADTLLANEFVAEVPLIRVVPPTVLVRDSLIIARRGVTIEVRYLGRAHTEGDLIVRVRERDVLFAGDLVGVPVPYVGNASFISEWISVLGRIKAYTPRLIVPGHGPIIRSMQPVDLLSRTFAKIDSAAREYVASGKDQNAFASELNLGAERQAFTGNDSAFDELWRTYFRAMALQQAFVEASGKLQRRAER